MLPNPTRKVKSATRQTFLCRVSLAGQPGHLRSLAPHDMKAAFVTIGLEALSRGEWTQVYAITQQIQERGLRHA